MTTNELYGQFHRRVKEHIKKRLDEKGGKIKVEKPVCLRFEGTKGSIPQYGRFTLWELRLDGKGNILISFTDGESIWENPISDYTLDELRNILDVL